jgi:hypothetical protein
MWESGAGFFVIDASLALFVERHALSPPMSSAAPNRCARIALDERIRYPVKRRAIVARPVLAFRPVPVMARRLHASLQRGVLPA